MSRYDDFDDDLDLDDEDDDRDPQEGREIVEVYRGHRIQVRRARCMGGWGMTYYEVYTDKGGHELECNFTEASDPIEDMVAHLKQRVDSALDGSDDWGLHEDMSPQERAAFHRWHGKPSSRVSYSRATDPVLRGTEFAR